MSLGQMSTFGIELRSIISLFIRASMKCKSMTYVNILWLTKGIFAIQHLRYKALLIYGKVTDWKLQTWKRQYAVNHKLCKLQEQEVLKLLHILDPMVRNSFPHFYRTLSLCFCWILNYYTRVPLGRWPSNDTNLIVNWLLKRINTRRRGIRKRNVSK